MNITKDEVLVLKNRKYKESDKLMTLFGLYKGKFTALAKGAQRPEIKKTGYLETGSLLKISLIDGYSFDIIGEVETIISPKSSKLSNKMALYMAELINKYTIDGDPNEEIFYAAEKYLVASKKDKSLYYAINELHLSLLKATGYLPDLEICALTGEKLSQYKKVYLSEDGPVSPNAPGILPSWPEINTKYFRALTLHSQIKERTNTKFEKNLFKVLNYITEKTLDKNIISKNLFV